MIESPKPDAKPAWNGSCPPVDRDTKAAPPKRLPVGLAPEFTSQLKRAAYWPLVLRNTELYRPCLFHTHGDNGELQPWEYGSNSLNSLGLCYVTFNTDDACPIAASVTGVIERSLEKSCGGLMINLFTSYLDLGDDYEIFEDTQ